MCGWPPDCKGKFGSGVAIDQQIVEFIVIVRCFINSSRTLCTVACGHVSRLCLRFVAVKNEEQQAAAGVHCAA